MTDAGRHCVVVGAGHAAAQLCASLTQDGWPGRITVVGDEPHAPYHRPPLSKSQLDPADPAPLQLIRPAAFYADHGVELLTGQRVVSIDRDAKQVRLNGRNLKYDTLVLATGSQHRKPPIPGVDHPRVFTLQTAAQAEAVRDQAGKAKPVVVIGAGFIGLEAASSLRKVGLGVTVLEFADRVLSRVTSPEVSDFFEQLHRDRGVDLHTGVMASAIEERGDGLCVRTKDGRAFAADFVVVGVGATPNVQPARDAGLDVDNGVHVDEHNRTADPSIFAVGDCCNQFHPLYETRLRLESVQNATDQAKTAAAAIAGRPRAHTALPWFWSDQYDVKLQIAGVCTGYDRCVLRPAPPGSAPGNAPETAPGSDAPEKKKPGGGGKSFSVWYFRGDRLLAVDAVNDSRAYAVASKIIPVRGCPDPALIADPAATPKAILQSAKES